MLTAAQKNRVVFVIMGLLMITALLWGHLFYLQVLHPRHWISVAHRQQFQVVELLPIRGAILDRQQKPLALSIRMSSIFADPRHVKDPAGVAQRLSSVLKVPTPAIEAKLLQKSRGFVWLARRIPNQAAASIRSMKLPGIYFLMEPKRVYPHGYLASHVIGFAGMDAKGLEGMEMVYDSILKGEPGWRWLMRDARRRTFSAWETPMVPARDGLELVLTLDTTIQFIAEEALDRAFRKSGSKGGSIVVMDPSTGEILALANRPTIDPNQYADFPVEARRNRVVTDTFEPGSVFKTVTAAVALGTGRVSPTERFYCEEGAYRVAGGHILHDVHPHGWLTFKEVVAQSSNIGVAKIAARLGPAAIYQGVKAFGFGEPTGAGLPGEVGGTTKPPSQWSKLSIMAIPMGQEVTVTALQLVQGMSAVANGGLLVRPWIVKEIRHPSGVSVKRFEPTVVRRVISPEVAKELANILVAVVEEGTGKLAQVPGFRTAGKTGTAQKVEPSGVYSHSKFVASFVGFVPVESPRLCIVVTLDEPRPVYPLYFGGVVAAPVFREVAADTLAYLQERLPQDRRLRVASRSGEKLF